MDTATNISQKEPQSAWQSVGEGIESSETYIREHPGQTALAAVGIGFLIAQLPARYLLGALFRVMLSILKSVAVIFALTKILEAIRDEEPGRRARNPTGFQPETGKRSTMPEVQLQAERM